MCLVLDNLDDDGQICRQLDQAGGVDDAVRANAGDTVNGGGAGETFGSESLDERTR